MNARVKALIEEVIKGVKRTGKEGFCSHPQLLICDCLIIEYPVHNERKTSTSVHFSLTLKGANFAVNFCANAVLSSRSIPSSFLMDLSCSMRKYRR